MKKSLLLILTGLAGLLCLGLASQYFLLHRMRPASELERGSPSLPRHLLIATQGSQFKNLVVAGILKRIESPSLHVKVIDIAGLRGIKHDEWQAILILHTWEMGKPPGVVSDFVKHLATPGKIIDITTSGSGRERLPGVDVISSASIVEDVPALVRQIGEKLDALLASDVR